MNVVRSARPSALAATRIILGASPTRDALVIARTAGSGETFVITSITSIRFQVRSGHDLTDLLQRLVVMFDRGRRAAARHSHSSDRRPVGSSPLSRRSRPKPSWNLRRPRAACLSSRSRQRVSRRPSVARRARSGRPVQRNGSIRRAATRTGRKARPALRPRPSRSQGRRPETDVTVFGSAFVDSAKSRHPDGVPSWNVGTRLQPNGGGACHRSESRRASRSARSFGRPAARLLRRNASDR